jgi:hypothetical protein
MLARRIVEAVSARKPEVVLTPAAQINPRVFARLIKLGRAAARRFNEQPSRKRNR